MNHGNTDNNYENTFVERLNQRLARLMGKKSGREPGFDSVPSNSKFMVIIFVMIVFLWFLTGVYYIPQGNYGLLLRQGKVSRVESGLAIGITLPYPFADVTLLDAGENNFSIGKLDSENFKLITADNQQLALRAEITYKIADPYKFYANYYQDNVNLDQRVSWLAMAISQDYILHHQSSTLLQGSTIVTANEIRKLSNKIIKNYGLEFNKFAIASLVNVSKSTNAINVINSTAPLGAGLLAEAAKYQQEKMKQTQEIITEFNQILPQYRANKKAIVELIYYKMLSAIPVESSPNLYPLLSMSMAQLLARQSGQVADLGLNRGSSQGLPKDIRSVNRTVDRERMFKDR